MIKKQIVSKGLDSVIYRGGFSTNKPSVVTMSVSHDIALDVSRFYEDKKQNIETTTGLIGVELVLVYAEEEEVILTGDKGEEEKRLVPPVDGVSVEFDKTDTPIDFEAIMDNTEETVYYTPEPKGETTNE